MKLFLKVLLFFVVVIGIFVALLYKSVTPPIIESNTLNITETIDTELDKLIDESNTTKILSLGIDTNVANKTAKDALLKLNMGDSDSNYVIKGKGYYIQGLWVDYGENRVNVNIGTHVDILSLKLKTRILISFDIDYSDDVLSLKLSKVKLGNLGLTWLVKLSPSLLKSLTGFDFNNSFDSILGEGNYTLDIKKLEVKVDIQNYINSNVNDPMLSSFVGLLTSNDLISIGVNEDKTKLGIDIDFKSMEDIKEDLDYSLHRFNNDQELTAFLQWKLIEKPFSRKIEFTDKELSQVLKYKLVKDSLEDYFSKSTMYKDYDFIIELPYIKIEDNLAILNIPFKFGKDNNYFQSRIKMDISFEKNGPDLDINLNDLEIVDLIIDDSIKDSMFKIIAGNDTKKVVIKKFFDSLTVADHDMSDEVVIENNKFVIKYSLSSILNP